MRAQELTTSMKKPAVAAAGWWQHPDQRELPAADSTPALRDYLTLELPGERRLICRGSIIFTHWGMA